MVLLARVDRFNRHHPWSHNDHYGRWVARRVAASGARHVLDVGCGTGSLLDRLRARAVSVTGIEPDPVVARVAEARFSGTPGVAVERAEFRQYTSGQGWDAITLVAVLHHLPLAPTLRELRGMLVPGGRLVIVGCYRAATWGDLLTSLVAIVANPAFGFAKHPSRAGSVPAWMTAPTTAPQETLPEIREQAAVELPGAKVRRRLFWRYSLVYDEPTRAAHW